MRGRSCRLAALVSATAWWLAGPTGGEAAAAPGATQASTPNHRPAQPTARAQPANDDCGSATVIQDLSFSPQPVDTTEATSADDDPLPSCLVDGSGTNSNSVWYTHTPACDGFLTVETCDSDYDTVLTVYAGGCDELDEAACNDDACSLGSQISRLAVTEGVPLLVEVTQFGQAGGGLLEFHFDIECGQSPVANDSCADATVIDVVPYVSPTSDTTEATSEADDPLQSCGFDGPSRNASSVWYTYTPTCDGALQASTCGSDYDTLVTVYTGDCGELAEVGCNDDSCDLQSEIKGLGVDQGQVLLVEVTAYGSSSGGVLAFNLDVECYAPPEQPSDPVSV